MLGMGDNTGTTFLGGGTATLKFWRAKNVQN